MLQVGETVTLWQQLQGQTRRQPVAATLLHLSEDGQWAVVRMPKGWCPQIRSVEAGRLSHAQPT